MATGLKKEKNILEMEMAYKRLMLAVKGLEIGPYSDTDKYLSLFKSRPKRRFRCGSTCLWNRNLRTGGSPVYRQTCNKLQWLVGEARHSDQK